MLNEVMIEGHFVVVFRSDDEWHGCDSLYKRCIWCERARMGVVSMEYGGETKGAISKLGTWQRLVEAQGCRRVRTA